MILVNIGMLFLFGLLLAGSARLVIAAASSFAKSFGFKNFIIGFILLGVTTSTPEFFVAFQSALDGVPQLSIGNLLGGSILLLSLVMGGSAVFLGKITLNHGMKFKEIVVASAVIAAPALALWDGSLSREDGVLLTGVSVIHSLFLSGQERLLPHIEKNFRKAKKTIGKDIVLFSVGLLGLTIASREVVHNAEIIISAFSIPAFFFGLFVLSVGTNLPEMSLAFASVMQRKRDIAYGDFLGSSAVNTLIIGLLGMVSPVTFVKPLSVQFSVGLLTLLCLYFVYTVSSGKVITRREGLGLLLFYIMFVFAEFFVGH